MEEKENQNPKEEIQDPPVKTPKKINKLLIILALLVLIFGANFILSRQTSTPPVSSTPSTFSTSPTSPVVPDVWKTYINKQYGFELKYPKTGIFNTEVCSELGSKCAMQKGECGKAIKEEGDKILVDNLFTIQILPFDETIDDYLKSKGAKDKYELKKIENSNTEEAIKVLEIKKGLELSSIGYPPLMYVTHIYKNNGKIFLLKHEAHPPNPFVKGGCINPKDLDAIKYKEYREPEWNIEESFKFIDQNKTP